MSTENPQSTSPGELRTESRARALRESLEAQPRAEPELGAPPGSQERSRTDSLRRLLQRRPSWLDWRVAGVLLLAAISLPVWHALNTHAQARTTPDTVDAAPTVAVARVTREDLYNEVPYPAEFRPYQEVELHAKVSGYVQEMNVDFGDKVKAGQLLAKLEVPELRDELNRALATQKRAEADYRDAHLVYTRLQLVQRSNPDLVAQQELDAAEAKDGTTEAGIAAAKAEVGKYQTLLAYTRIAAPFDGVITHRYADPGALIQAGTASDTQSLPLVRISDNYRLRLDFPVDVAYVKDVHVGDPVEVRIQSLNRSFTGTITRATLKVNEDTRKMTTEIEVPNPNLELVPGMYCRVMLKVNQQAQALAIPIQAVPPGQTNSVYVINSQNQIEERPVTLGIDTPAFFQVLGGLKEGELVFTGSRGLVQPGEKVQPKVVNSLAQE